MRGLKPNNDILFSIEKEVASFTDAWIETNPYLSSLWQGYVASFTDAWIET